MIQEFRNHSYSQRLNDLKFISLSQIKQRGELIKLFKFLNGFTTSSERGLFDSYNNDRTRNIGA